MARANPESIDIFTLPSLPWTERALLPECPAVYFVLEKSRVLYVGQTTQLRTRWQRHHLSLQLSSTMDVRIAWYETADSCHRWQLENQGVTLFHPRYNKALVRRLPTHKTIGAAVPNHLYNILETLAIRANTSMSEQVKTLIREALEQRGILFLEP